MTLIPGKLYKTITYFWYSSDENDWTNNNKKLLCGSDILYLKCELTTQEEIYYFLYKEKVITLFFFKDCDGIPFKFITNFFEQVI